VEVGGKGGFSRTRRSRRQMLPAGKQQQQYKQKGGSIACGRGVALTLDNFFSPHIIFFPFFQQTFAIFVVAGKAVQ